MGGERIMDEESLVLSKKYTRGKIEEAILGQYGPIPDSLLSDGAEDIKARFSQHKTAWINGINGLDFGTVTDWGVVINNLIANCSEHDTIYLPYNIYNHTTPILINKPIKIICEGILSYTGAGFGVILSTNLSNIDIYKITSTSGGFILNAVDGVVQLNKVNVQSIIAGTDGLKMYSHKNTIASNIVYNDIRLNYCSGVNNAIKLEVDETVTNGNSYIGENTIYGGRVTSSTGYGLNADSVLQSGIQGVKFYNVALEGVVDAVRLKNVTSSIINYPRYFEGISNKILILEGGCRDNVFNGNVPIAGEQIDVSLLTTSIASNRINAVNAPVYNTLASSTVVAEKCILVSEGIICSRKSLVYKNISSSPFNPTIENNLPNYFLISTASVIINLSASYRAEGINTIYIKQSGSLANTAIVKDVSGTTIFDGAAHGYSTIKLTCVGDLGLAPTGWIAEIIATLSATTTWDPISLADGEGITSPSSITMAGVVFGDYIMVSAPYDLQGVTATAYVSGTNSVKIRLQNETGGTVDFASGTWKVRVIR